MPNKTIQRQGEVFISQSEYDALKAAGSLQNNTKYYITKDPNNLTKPDANTLYIPKSTFTAAWQVIMSSDPKSELTVLDVRNSPANHALAQFDSVGRLQASNPDGTSPATEAEKYVANVGYVHGYVSEQIDINQRYFHHITVATSNANGAVCFTVENYDSSSIDTQEALIDLFNGNIGASDWLSATGHLDTNMVYAVYGGTSMFVKMYNLTSEQDVEENIVNYGTLTVTDKVL